MNRHASRQHIMHAKGDRHVITTHIYMPSVTITSKSNSKKIEITIQKESFIIETVLLARQRWKKLRLGIWRFLNVFHFTPPLNFIFKLWWCFIIDFSFLSSSLFWWDFRDTRSHETVNNFTPLMMEILKRSDDLELDCAMIWTHLRSF